MTKSRNPFKYAVGCFLLFLIPGALGQTLQITDADGHTTAVTAAQMVNLPHVTMFATMINLPSSKECPWRRFF
jgi:hypothetical protein